MGRKTHIRVGIGRQVAEQNISEKEYDTMGGTTNIREGIETHTSEQKISEKV